MQTQPHCTRMRLLHRACAGASVQRSAGRWSLLPGAHGALHASTYARAEPRQRHLRGVCALRAWHTGAASKGRQCALNCCLCVPPAALLQRCSLHFCSAVRAALHACMHVAACRWWMRSGSCTACRSCTEVGSWGAWEHRGRRPPLCTSLHAGTPALGGGEWAGRRVDLCMVPAMDCGHEATASARMPCGSGALTPLWQPPDLTLCCALCGPCARRLPCPQTSSRR